MLAIRIDLLAERYTATEFNDRNRAEWPPHPGRLFSALVAAWADQPAPSPDERRAIEWLEGLDPPAIVCDVESEGSPSPSRRAVVTSYVPNSDPSSVDNYSKTYAALSAAKQAVDASASAEPKVRLKLEKALMKARAKSEADSSRMASKVGAPLKAIEVLPEQRGRQARTYPTIVPLTPTVTMVWPEAEPPAEVSGPLDTVLSRIARLGHSSSMVACSIVDEVDPPVLVPSPDGDLALRVPAAGLFAALERAFDRHGGTEPRVLPHRIARYGLAAESSTPIPRPVLSGRWLVLRLLDQSGRGASVSPRNQLAIARAVRGAILRHAAEPIPEALSGHDADGRPSGVPHLAVVPLPFAAHGHADAQSRFVALVLPQFADGAADAALAAAIGAWIESGAGLRPSGRRPLRVEVVSSGERSVAANPRTWTRPAFRWISATPVMLDRFPKHFHSADPVRRDAAEGRVVQTIRQSCVSIGLPEPSDVRVSLHPLLNGSAPVGAYEPYERGGQRRFGIHAELVFERRVAGPVVLGAGRYLGYGLCIPLDHQAGSREVAS